MDSNGRRPLATGAWPGAWWAAILTPSLLFFASGSVSAVEPSEEFLRGLQDRGLNELALDYLDRMQTGPLADEKFRGQIPYHRGVLLIAASRQAADPDSRNRLLDQARTELEQFAESNPENISGADAQMQLAMVMMERGQQQIAQADSLPGEPAYEAQRREIRQQARRLLADARTMFQSAEGIYSAELEKLPPAGGEEESGPENLRRDYRDKVAQLLYYAGRALYEAARTYDPKSEEFRELNESAAKELAAVFEEFSRAFPLPGFYARLYEGRCYHALGKYQMALGSYEDVRSLPNILPPLRKLIASAYRARAECLLSEGKLDEAIADCQACLKNARTEEIRQPEWLAVRFQLAEALTRKGGESSSGSLEQRKLVAEARDSYRVVATTPGEFQSAARLAALKLRRDGPAEQAEPRTFQEAYDRGKDGLASYNAAKLAMPSAEKNNPDAVAELRAQMEQGEDDARYNFQLATTLIDDDTDPVVVNEVRYFLCWLYWEEGDYYRSGTLGEFLARRYPSHPAARSAAKLAMASFERLYQQAAASAGGNPAATEFEARRVAELAEFVTRRWPDSPEADAAFSVLVSYALRRERLDEAQALLNQVSDSSRPRLEMQLGNAMWGRYLELAQKSPAARPDEATLGNLKAAALKYLQSGFEASRKNKNIDESVAAAGFYLVQSKLADGDYAAAIELLEDSQRGPLTLVTSGDPAAARSQYQIEVYKAALQAYVSVSPPRGDDAVKIIKALEQVVAADANADASQLTRIYVGLGSSLQRQVTQLHDAGRDEEAARFRAAFSELLDRIRARQDGAGWPARLWIAQNHYEMGSEPVRASTGPNAQAGSSADYAMPTLVPATGAPRENLVKARDAFQKLLASAEADPNFAPNEAAVLAVRLQLGECYRQLGEYQHALDTFSEILKDKEASLTVQRAAAYAYQQRGQKGDAKWLEHAIQGGYRLKSTGKNRIWGWVRLSQVAQRAAAADKKYWDAFFEARLNIVHCRFAAALKTSGAERQRNLSRAKQNIQSLLQLYPTLGGDFWRGQFDALAKKIQEAEGQPKTGLKEFNQGS